jgi:hypothetical protein
MARLSDQEKTQLKEATARKSPRAPAPPVLPAERFLGFAAFASGLCKPAAKPVRFGGNHWKL